MALRAVRRRSVLSSAIQRQLSGDPGGASPLFTFSAVLITEHPKLAFAVPPQPVRTEQPRKLFIRGANGPTIPNRSIDYAINSLRLTACASTRHSYRLRHPFRLRPMQGNSL
jgi:hypothetical protein